MTASSDDIGVVILAGGLASRLPAKLSLDVGGLPLLERVYENLSPGRPTLICCHDGLAAGLARSLPCRVVNDRFGRRGPLGGLLSALAHLPTSWIFAAAGDAPLLDARLIDHLARARLSDDEAVVPTCGGILQPLAALYETAALRLQAARLLRGGGSPGVRSVLAQLRHRTIAIDDDWLFANVNTAADYGRLGRRLASAAPPPGAKAAH
ncbi:MAG: molybdenum cofactor guanylyltransferase [Candidatus Eremiobacteraeota bacterium]|nr:molybdenum cofactor guanylyltransferase [Candidatus Eremiobacteraeota bacterium]